MAERRERLDREKSKMTRWSSVNGRGQEWRAIGGESAKGEADGGCQGKRSVDEDMVSDKNGTDGKGTNNRPRLRGGKTKKRIIRMCFFFYN